MAWLCRMCQTETDGSICEYCASPAVEVPQLWELKIATICSCGSRVVARVDHDKPDMLDLEFTEFRYCPVCMKSSIHERILLKIVDKPSHDVYLAKTLANEVRIGDR